MSSPAGAAQSRLAALSKDRAELLKLLLEKEGRDARRVRRCARGDAGVATRFPLSWAQQRLWLIDQIEEGRAAYNMTIALRLRGTLDRGALQRALDSLMRRHEILRTTFVTVAGEPMQEISPGGRFELTLIDLSGHEVAQRQTELESQKKAEVRGGFDLRVGPLIRGRLLHLQPHEHVLLITMHHIVSDGWSLGIFIRELADSYAAYREGRSNPLPPLSIQYADYAQWQRESSRDEVMQEQLAYWRAHLQGAPPQLELPTDRPRPDIQSYRGASLPVVFDAELSARVRTLAQQHDVTLFMVLYAAWSILLARLSGQQDIVIGIPTANRERPELDGLIGLFLNTLVVRTGVHAQSRVTDFIKAVQGVTVAAYDHQHVPFERIVEVVQPLRSLGRNPLFQVMLSLQNAPTTELSMPGLTVTEEPEESEHSIVDLFLSLEERREQIVGRVMYATDLFEKDTVARCLECFKTLLTEMTNRPQCRIGDLPMVPQDERSRILCSFNDTDAAYPQGRLVHELFEDQVLRTPDAVAVVCAHQSLTYTELNSRADSLACYLRTTGVAADQLVAICVERGIEMVVGLLGVLKAGGAYVPLDPNYPAERLQYMLRDAAPRVVLTQEKLRSTVGPATAHVVCLDADWDEIVQDRIGARAPDSPQFNPRQLAYVIYTSGSTGRPKGVMVEHAGVVNFLASMQRDPGIRPADRLLAVTTISFDIAALEIYLPLISGAKLVLANRETVSDPRAVMTMLDELDITILQATPATWNMLLTAGWTGRERLKALCGGEALSTELSRRLLGRVAGLWNLYGPTETTIWSCRHQLCAAGAPRGPAESIGAPIENTQIYVLDQCGHPVPIGVSGEIYIGGTGVARGYHNQPELTAQRFSADPFNRVGSGRIYRTGDLGRWRSDAVLEYLGRNDDQVKVRGFRIELGEIESQLALHAQVKEAVVIAREDAAGEKRLVGYVTVRDEGTTVEELRSHLRSTLPEHMIPSAIVKLGRLPLTPNGKVNRRALPAPELAAYASRQYEAPGGDIEHVLAGIWKALLRIERVGRHDNFFELGGHSLHAVKLSAQVAEQLHVNLPIPAVFRYPEIQPMAELVRSLKVSQTSTASREGSIMGWEPALPMHAVGQTRSSGVQIMQAPLTFSQLEHWRMYRLDKRRHLRQVASAMRLSGRLNVEALRMSVAELVRRHDALRTRIVVRDGVPSQEISDSSDRGLEIEDLRTLSQHARDAVARQKIEVCVTELIDVTADPLFVVRLLRLSDDEHVLIVAIEHIIADGFSRNVLLQELFSTYVRILQGRRVSLPPIRVKLADYAIWQRSQQQPWQEKHASFWNERFSRYRRTRFPRDEETTATKNAGWSLVHFQIAEGTKTELREWARQRRITLVMAVLTAYAAVLSRWCGVSNVLVSYQLDGRLNRDLENTIGYFAFLLPLCVSFHEDDSFVDIAGRIKEEYCNAYEHSEFGYVADGGAEVDVARSVAFNWLPSGAASDLAELRGTRDALACTPVPLEELMLKRLQKDSEPAVLLTDAGSEIVGGVYFTLDRFSRSTMERFAHNFQMFIRALLESPERRVVDVPLL